VPRSKPASHRRALAALAAGAALVVMTIGSAAAARNQTGTPAHAGATWAVIARMWLVRAELTGADRDEVRTLNGWLGLDDPNEPDNEEADETPDPGETPDAAETPEPKETPEPAETAKPAKASSRASSLASASWAASIVRSPARIPLSQSMSVP